MANCRIRTGPTMMPSYAALRASGFARCQLAIQLFDLLGGLIPLLERGIELPLRLFELRAERCCVACRGRARIKLRILQRRGNSRDPRLELADRLFGGFDITLRSSEVPGQLAPRSRALRGFLSSRAFESLTLVN